MSRHTTSLLVGLMLASGMTASAQWVQRNYTLQPGWNAIFLDVLPEPADCDTLFDGLPVESVWDFNPSAANPQFVQDPATLIAGSPDWLTWFPPGSDADSTGNLFTLRDGRAFLIKLADSAPFTVWSVTGRPSLRKLSWRPGAVNFVGFRVGPTGPTFQALFSGEAGLAGQPVYRLNSVGSWETVTSPTTTRPLAGAAYWIRCAAPAQRSSTIEVDAGSLTGLTFDHSLISESTLRVRNTSASSRNIILRLLSSASPPSGQPADAGQIPLDYWRADYASGEIGWSAFPSILSHLSLSPGAEWNIRVGFRRPIDVMGTPGSAFQGVIEVSDDLGSRWWVPASAGADASGVPAGATLNEEAPPPLVGLWVGEAVIDTVSQPAHPGNALVPRPTGGAFAFRVLLHLDGNGASRLLQHVFLVRRPPVLVPDPENEGANIIAEPARLILSTDESLIPSLIGGGDIVGRRISTTAFGFPQPIQFAGGPFGTGVLNASVVLGHDDPLNPFVHRFHPDHDNLDERFEQVLPEGRESFTVTRHVTLEFTGVDPLGLNPPGWGTSELGGTYRETIQGLHRTEIRIAGTFRLTRIAAVAQLHQ